MIKDVSLRADGIKIAGQLYLPENVEEPYPAVVLCHGIPSGIVDPTDGGYQLLAKTIGAEGFAVLTFSFRGSGISGGNFDIAGWTHDLKTAIDHLWSLPEIDDAHLFLCGFSAGASVSVVVAAEDKRISGMIACACPADFDAITAADEQATINYFRQIGIIRDPDFPPSREEWLNNFRKVNALHSVADIAPRPLLLVHSTEDKVVPVSNARKLYQAAGEPREIVIIAGNEHRLRRNDKAVDTIIKWLKKNLN